MESTARFVDTKYIEKHYGIRERWLEKARAYKPADSPTYIKVGRRVLYPLNGPNGLEAWIAARTVANVKGGS